MTGRRGGEGERSRPKGDDDDDVDNDEAAEAERVGLSRFSFCDSGCVGAITGATGRGGAVFTGVRTAGARRSLCPCTETFGWCGDGKLAATGDFKDAIADVPNAAMLALSVAGTPPRPIFEGAR